VFFSYFKLVSVRKDHFVPVAYLNNFTNNTGKFHQVTKRDWRHSYIYPAQTCWKDHGNELPKELLDRFGLTDPMIVERQAFAQYENIVQDLSNLFLSHAPMLANKQYVILCQGYILHKQRTPYYQKGVDEVIALNGKEYIDKAVKEQREKMTAHIKSLPDYEQIKNHPNIIVYLSDNYWNTLRQKLQDEKHDSHRTQLFGILTTAMGRNIESVKMLGKLSVMELTIFNAANGHHFFTSDNPGFSTGLDATQPSGFATSNTNFNGCLAVSLPINSKQAVFIQYGNKLITDSQDRAIKYRDVSIQETISFNHSTIDWADEKIICADKKDLMRYKPV